MAARPSAPRLARDIRGQYPSPAASRARCLFVRARSRARTAARFAVRSLFCCWPRRRSRHFFPHVSCVPAADRSGRYQLRQTQQRRRFSLLVVTPRRSPSPSSLPTFWTHLGRASPATAGGSPDRRSVDQLDTAAKAFVAVERHAAASSPPQTPPPRSMGARGGCGNGFIRIPRPRDTLQV